MGLSKIALSKFKKEVQVVIIYVNAHYMDKLTPVSYTHLDVYKRQAVLVDDVGHFLHQTGDLAALECLKILVLLGGHAVLVVVVALIRCV